MEEDHNGITEIQPVSPEKEEREDQPSANTHQEFETKPEEGLRKRKNSSLQDEPNSNSNVNGNSASKKEGSTPNVFFFWAFFVGMVSLVTLAFVIISSVVSPGDEKSEFLSMPPDLRSHYSKGKMIKVQIGEERNSIQMFVREEGRRGNAETVVLLHGFGGSSFSFRHVISMLASRGIRAVALDLPGAGFSDKTNLQIDRGWPGFLGRIRNVYLEIKEKGLFWGFDQLIETGGMPHVSYEPKVRKSYQVLQCGAQELGQGLGQVIESLSLGPVHLVVHDTGFETGAIWAVSNPSLVRSVTLLDATSHRPSVPLWVLRMPGVRELMIHFDFLQLAMFKMCCSRSIDRSAAEGHGFLLRTKNGAKAAVEIGSRANSSFDFEGWANADQMKDVPMQILWANGWSKDWQREGHLLAQRLSRAELVFHGGGRWPQVCRYWILANATMEIIGSFGSGGGSFFSLRYIFSTNTAHILVSFFKEDIAEEITEAIAKFVCSLPPTAKTVVEEPLPEHIQRMFDEGHGHHHGHHDHVHHHGDHGHSHGGGYMDGYGLGHGAWH